ncbi:hypothetical protein [Lysinibacillus sp. NPDC047702]|uniref:hypothetical protein n=1 Tax=unclassified Lysinibacillus TaxID=2636778 RepID=UPI003D00C498
MKLKFRCLLSIILCLSLLNGCSNGDSIEGTYISFARKENLSEELRELLLVKLKENNIDYIIDTKGSVYVGAKDVDKAVSCCS